MRPIAVLLVEDDVDLRETATEFLASEDFEVHAAANGAEGVQKAMELLPEVIVCDIHMPGLNGYEVYNTLSQIPSTATIPFIFLTAKSSREDILLGLHLGADDYVTKPFEMAELVAIIRRRVAQRRRLLALANEKFNALVSSSWGGVCLLAGGRIEFANPGMGALFGVPAPELVGRALLDLVHPDDAPRLGAALRHCQEQAKPSFAMAIRVRPADGRALALEVRGQWLSQPGERRVLLTLAAASPAGPCARGRSSVRLSAREREVLSLICQGLANAQIADRLCISERTVEGHRARLFHKTETRNAVALAMWAVRQGYASG